MSCHRSHISWPLFTVTGRLAALAVRFAAALPSRAPAVGVLIGLVKSREANDVHPVLGVSASVIVPALATCYWNVSVWVAWVALPPFRHCSPMKLMSSELMVPPVLFVNF